MLSFFPRGVLDEILNLIESVSEGFPSYFSLAESWKVFANKIIKLVESDIPECKGPRDPTKKKPYVNNCCLTAIKQKHSKWTKYLHCKSDGNYYQYKINRNEVISELRKAKYYHEKNLAAKIKIDSKLFWAYVRSKLKTKSAMGQLDHRMDWSLMAIRKGPTY